VLKASRIQQLIHRHSALRLAQRIMTSHELNRFQGVNWDRQSQQLANTWVVKEAAYKAMYPTLVLGWKDMELTYMGIVLNSLTLSDRKPYLTLPQNYKTHTSLSHDGDYTVAFVMIEK
jgi:holo-[acyl-carrier protein] synthase